MANNKASRKAKRLNKLRLWRRMRQVHRQRLIATLERGYVDARIGVSWSHMDGLSKTLLNC